MRPGHPLTLLVLLVAAAGCSGSSAYGTSTPKDAGSPTRDTGAHDATPSPTDASTDATDTGAMVLAPESGTGTGVDSAFMEAAADAPPSIDSSTADAPIVGCGAYAGDTSFTCSADGNSRGECVGGSANVQACANGCLREPAGQDSICMGTTDNWSCNGSYGADRALDGNYDLTSFGCWTDASGTVHTDPGDNCIPSCLSQAQAAGLCDPAADGPTCEQSVNWYTADGARFGCLQRVRITNSANGMSVIAVALDFGPSCSVESMVSKAVLDASGRVDQYLFGGDQGVSDMAAVHVVEVDNSTPLGPVP